MIIQRDFRDKEMTNLEKRLYRVRERELRMVLNYINISPDTRILEIGCGDGCQSFILRTYSNYVVSTDITTEYGYTELNVLCNGEYLPFKDSQFDIVYSSNVLEHIRDKRKALNEMKHVLADDGTIIIMVPTSTVRILYACIYYPYMAYCFLRLILERIFQEKVTIRKEKHPLTYYCLPLVHGTYRNIFEETKSYLIRNWVKLFRNDGLEVLKVVKTLLYAPLEFPLPVIDLSRVGICSTVAFILKKKLV